MNFRGGRRRRGPCRGRFAGRLSGMSVLEHGGPFVGKVDLLLGAGLICRRGRHWFGGGRRSRRGLGGRRFFLDCGRLGGNFLHGNFRNRRGGGFRLDRRREGGQIRIAQTGGALESAAKLAETLGATLVGTIDVNLFELGGELGGTAIIAGPEDKIEKLFKSRSVPRSAAQNGFEEADGFLGKAIAGEKIDVRKGLGDEFLGLIVKGRLGGNRDL